MPSSPPAPAAVLAADWPPSSGQCWLPSVRRTTAHDLSKPPTFCHPTATHFPPLPRLSLATPDRVDNASAVRSSLSQESYPMGSIPPFGLGRHTCLRSRAKSCPISFSAVPGKGVRRLSAGQCFSRRLDLSESPRLRPSVRMRRDILVDLHENKGRGVQLHPLKRRSVGRCASPGQDSEEKPRYV